MKRLLLSYIFLLPYLVEAQNLIANGSFEIINTCPGFVNGFSIDKAYPWQSATINASPSIIFNICATDSLFGVPINGNNLESFQNPASGNGYVGFAVFSSNVADFRQYIRYPFDEALSPGVTYCLTFYVSLYNSTSDAIDAIGAYFSDSALL
jgi:hypothetical protein